MSELKEEHFEVISENVAECSAFNMQELYSEMQRMKRIRKDVK